MKGRSLFVLLSVMLRGVAPKVFKEPRGGSHPHQHADQLTLKKRRNGARHHPVFQEILWVAVRTAKIGVYTATNISEKPGEERHPVLQPQKLVVPNPETSTTPTIAHVPNLRFPFQRTILFGGPPCMVWGTAQKTRED
jgi:hypothetical protein